MERVVVYGLGRNYQENKAWIEKQYSVIGYCDKDENKLKAVSKPIVRAELGDWQNKVDKILVTLDRPWDIINDLQSNYGVDISKIELFVPKESIRKGVVFPEQLFFAPYNEDALILLAINKLGLNLRNVKYLEYGTENILAGSFSYYFYMMGSSGVVVGNMNKQLLDLGRVFRPKDILKDYAEYGSFQDCLADNNKFDLLIVHDSEAIDCLYDYILCNTDLPRLIYADNITEQYKTFMLLHGFCWYSTTINGMIFYRKTNYEKSS